MRQLDVSACLVEVREAAHGYTITAFEVIEKPAREMNLEPRAEPFKTDSVVGHFLAKCRAHGSPMAQMRGRGWGGPPLGFTVSVFVSLSSSHLTHIHPLVGYIMAQLDEDEGL